MLFLRHCPYPLPLQSGTMSPRRFSVVPRSFSNYAYLPRFARARRDRIRRRPPDPRRALSEYDLEKERRAQERAEHAARWTRPARQTADFSRGPKPGPRAVLQLEGGPASNAPRGRSNAGKGRGADREGRRACVRLPLLGRGAGQSRLEEPHHCTFRQ